METITSTQAWSDVTNISKQNAAHTPETPKIISFHGQLYAFYRGDSDAGTIYACRSVDGETWSEQINITASNEARTAHTPVPLVVNNKLFIFYRDKKDNKKICSFSTLDGSTWSSVTEVSEHNGAKTSIDPVPVFFKNQLYVFYRGDSDKNYLYATRSTSGDQWSEEINITKENNARTSDVPVPIVFGSKLYVFFRGHSDKNNIDVFSTVDGESWSKMTKISDLNKAQTSATPAPVLFNGKLYVFYRGKSDDGNIYAFTTTDGNHWSAQIEIYDKNGARTSDAPVPIVLGNDLFVFYRGSSVEQNIHVFTTPDGNHWLSTTNITERNQAKTSGKLRAAIVNHHLTVVYRSTDDKKDLCAFKNTEPQAWTTRLVNIPKTFGEVSERGTFDQCVVWDVAVNPWNHIQSMEPYRQWFFCPRNRKFEDHGTMYIINRTDDVDSRVIETPEEGYNHPGGCQVIGDYLALAIENESGTEGYVRFYDLSRMTDDKNPTLLTHPRVKAPKGAGSVGITDIGSGADRRYVLSIYDDGSASIYLSNSAQLSDPSCEFTFLFTAKLGEPGPDSMALLTDIDDKVYLVALGTNGPLNAYVDWAMLYEVDLTGHKFDQLSKRHMFTTPPSGTPVNYIHFRFGAGVRIVSQTQLQFVCSDRNANGKYLDYNTFYTSS